MGRHPLDDARLKLKRAEHHINDLNRKFKPFCQPNAYTLRGKFEPEDSNEFVVGVYGRPIPNTWPPIIGDTLHNLSALDHVAWQLALKISDDPPSGTEFPIFLDRLDFHKRKRNGSPAPGSGFWKLRGIDPAAATRIEALQPYNRTDIPPGADPLWRLHELNREDKHRFLHVAAFQIHSVSIRLEVDGEFRGGLLIVLSEPLTDGAEVYRKRLEGGPDLDVKVYGELTPDIAFAQIGAITWGRSVIDVLLRIGDHIVTAVIPKLEPFL